VHIETSLSLAGVRAPWRSYLELTKPRVVALMVFTAIVGMLLSTRGSVPWHTLLFGSLGIGLVAGAGGAVNHLVDQRADAIMARTRNRPLPRGALCETQAAVFAVGLGVAGMALLMIYTNRLCAVLTFLSLIGYAVVYSVFLKRSTPQNIVIGGAAGAAPPLLGWVAAAGEVEPGALLLFVIILLWTPPHFWALAIHRRDDYARAEIPMLPVTHGIAFTSERILAYAMLLCAVTIAPYLIGMSGRLYLSSALLLGGRFIWFAWRLRQDVRFAMPTFRYSILYLFVLFAVLLADHYTPAG
jgi:protoheme IX farnesyltransferase